MKIKLLIILVLALLSFAFSETRTVLCFKDNISTQDNVCNNNDSLLSAVAKSGNYDYVIIGNGVWKDLAININTYYLRFLAEETGKVFFTGQSSIIVNAKKVEIRGITFKDGGLPPGSESIIKLSGGSNESTIEDCVISYYNPEDPMTEYDWIHIGKGNNNKIRNNIFEGKNHKGTLIEVRHRLCLQSSEACNIPVFIKEGIVDNQLYENTTMYYPSNTGNNIIEKNTFIDCIKGNDNSNGYEIIRIGLDVEQQIISNNIVRMNLFENILMEDEIISSKSTGNKYLNNVFKNCRGGLSLRHGNDNVVMGNVFMRGNEFNDNMSGLFIMGEGHIVVNNYFQGLNGNAIQIRYGDKDVYSNSSNGFAFVKDLILSFNTFVDCSRYFYFYQHEKQLLSPTEANISHNIFQTGTELQDLFLVTNTGDWNSPEQKYDRTSSKDINEIPDVFWNKNIWASTYQENELMVNNYIGSVLYLSKDDLYKPKHELSNLLLEIDLPENLKSIMKNDLYGGLRSNELMTIGAIEVMETTQHDPNYTLDELMSLPLLFRPNSRMLNSSMNTNYLMPIISILK
ncbi:MAG: hypothetical protein OCC49_18945 [Fibrobacterales bacterium]